MNPRGGTAKASKGRGVANAPHAERNTGRAWGTTYPVDKGAAEGGQVVGLKARVEKAEGFGGRRGDEQGAAVDLEVVEDHLHARPNYEGEGQRRWKEMEGDGRRWGDSG